MEITCKDCGTKLRIPDEKVPQGQKVNAACPKCKAKLTLGPQEAPPTRESVEEKTPEYDYGVEDSALDSYDEGVKLALVLEADPEAQKKFTGAVERLGYKAVSAANSRDAINKMRFHHFHLIILSDRYDDVDLDQSPVLLFLNRLSMSVRRKIFLALAGEAFHSMDGMVAFSMSANIVIGRKDIDRVEVILKKSIAENQNFYKIYTDSLKEIRGV